MNEKLMKAKGVLQEAVDMLDFSDNEEYQADLCKRIKESITDLEAEMESGEYQEMPNGDISHGSKVYKFAGEFGA